jgi:hypothetical protein
VSQIEQALSHLGIDPQFALDGFRAENAFTVATMLAAIGFRVLPVNQKIPIIRGWPDKATSDPKMLVQWYRFLQPSCWGILTGCANRLVILDFDGEKGRADRDILEHRFGPLPETWSVKTGRDGASGHLWYRTDGTEDLRTVSHVFGCSIDVRAARGFAVTPGSIRKSRIRYRWERAPNECELAQLPEAWREALPKRVESSSSIRVRSSRRVKEASPTHTQHDASYYIGDGEGRGGFNRPIYARCCQYFSRFGVDRDPVRLKDKLRSAILNAPRAPGRTQNEIERYASDAYLDLAIENARAFVKGTME